MAGMPAGVCRRVPSAATMASTSTRLLAGTALASGGCRLRRGCWRRRFRCGGSLGTLGVLARQRARLLVLHHRRRRDDGFVHRYDEVAKHGVVELERVLELRQGLGAALEVHQHVVRLVDLLDRICELAAPPVLEPVNPAAGGRHHRAVALDHGGYLLALIGMHDEYDFVVTHQQNSPLGHVWRRRREAANASGLPYCY